MFCKCGDIDNLRGKKDGLLISWWEVVNFPLSIFLITQNSDVWSIIFSPNP